MDLAVGREFDYLVPAELEGVVQVGSRVKVPFGPRQALASVIEILEASTQSKLRTILKVTGQTPLVTPKVMELARWIARYYCCPIEIALRSVLPDAVRQEAEGWRELLFVRALTPSGAALPLLTARQREVWNIIEEWREVPLQELVRLAQTTTDTVRRLEDRGLVTIGRRVSERDPYAHEHILPTSPLALNEAQAAALRAIVQACDAAPPQAAATAARASASTFLLQGVTGSGKTEVYLQAIAHTLAQGRGAIVLVPEISLTPQTVERFKARFSSGSCRTLVAVLHSHLSAGERHDEWHKIRQGRARIVIGARSAIFAPVDPLGLIIVDEEHEHSYKQEESPRYHARDVAVMRGRMEQAVVVLGSATPSLESFYNARQGKYALLELAARADDRKLPIVRVIDMRQELRHHKGPPVLSLRLKEAITARLERGEQVMLFLNRRGYATVLQCLRCGWVAGCPNCSVSLTFHRAAAKLCCHVCGYEAGAPARCPEPRCGDPSIRYSGLGTQRVEETLAKLFPQARTRRMDSDAMSRKDDYRRILGDFRAGKLDILVGTQMIAKGLHFPNVTLVGIVHADLGLHMPDFRAGERTFQLLTQVAGRAGRGDVEGEVIVQAFTPFHPSIQCARRHDYLAFYEQEIQARAQLRYPPFSRVALLTLKGRNDDKVKFIAEHVKKELAQATAGIPRLILAGPGPAPLLRAQSLFRYQLMLRAPQMSKLGPVLSDLCARTKLPDDVTLSVDVDPVDLF
jgi:primosomal protein N' (replication factor Y)